MPQPPVSRVEERDSVHYANIEEMYRRQAIIGDRMADLVTQLAVISDRQKRMYQDFTRFERVAAQKLEDANKKIAALTLSNQLLASKRLWMWGIITSLAAIILWFVTVGEKFLSFLGKK